MKVIIDIDEDMYKACQRAVNNPKMTVDEVDVAIANGTPVLTEGDLISREALKKAIQDNGYKHYFEIFEIIDNAPTVEEKSYAMGYQDGVEDGLDEIRPQGKWEIVDEEGGIIWKCVCTECRHDPQEYISGTEDRWLRKPLPNFCPNCGADMRMEGEED